MAINCTLEISCMYGHVVGKVCGAVGTCSDCFLLPFDMELMYLQILIHLQASEAEYLTMDG